MNRKQRRAEINRLQKSGIKRAEAIKVVETYYSVKALEEGKRVKLNYEFMIRHPDWKNQRDDFKDWVTAHKDEVFTVEYDKTKKEKKAKVERKRLKGTTFWYGTTKPAFLIERIFASGPNFEAKINDISNDQDLLGKPMKGEGAFSVGKTSHTANLVVDARKNSTAKLVTVSYSGKGFGANIDGSKIASASGIPSIEGTASLSVKGAFDMGGFDASGSVDLNPVKLTSDGLGNEIVTKYYNTALASVTRLTAGYKASYTEKDGVGFSLNGNFADQFGKALMAAVSEVGQDAKKQALAKINEKINGSSSEAMNKIKEFAGIQGDIDVQNANFASIQKLLDNKKSQVEAEIKKKAGAEATKALEKAGVPLGTKDAANALKKKLPF